MRALETRNFIYTIQNQPDKVTAAVNGVLRQEVTIPEKDEVFVVESTTWSIKYRSAREIVPPWMRVAGVYRMAGEISSTPVWKNLLSVVTPDIQTRVATELHSETPEQSMAIQNARFVTSAISLGLLAAASGDEVWKCIDISRTPLDIAFALQIGAKYKDAPNDIDDYMARVSELIPNPDTTPSDGEGTMLHFFNEYNAFTSPKTSVRCPATYFTRLILEQMGRQLHTDDAYKQRFQTSIMNETETNIGDV